MGDITGNYYGYIFCAKLYSRTFPKNALRKSLYHKFGWNKLSGSREKHKSVKSVRLQNDDNNDWRQTNVEQKCTFVGL